VLTLFARRSRLCSSSVTNRHKTLARLMKGHDL
jgi:hypothetical protein